MPKQRIIPVFVPHIGCPNLCVFCNQHSISGEKEPQTPENVSLLIEEALKVNPADALPEVAFYGGSFTAIPEAEQNGLLNAAVPFLAERKISGIRVSTRPDAMDEKTAVRLKTYGVKTVELGVQSMQDSVLMLSGRGHDSACVFPAVEALKAAGISVILQMMTGLPGDTDEGALFTAETICRLRPDGVRIYPTVVLKDTLLHKEMLAGRYRPQTVDEAVALCVQLKRLFEAASIPIIRMGLNPSDELSGGEAVAGAYHPAFGELVLSRQYLEKALVLLSSVPAEAEITLICSRRRTSAVIGQKRRNLLYLQKRFLAKSVRVLEADLSQDELQAEWI